MSKGEGRHVKTAATVAIHVGCAAPECAYSDVALDLNLLALLRAKCMFLSILCAVAGCCEQAEEISLLK